MRARVYSNGGISTGGFTFNGGQLTGALILAGNPSDPLEAAAKQYVDSSLVNLNASNLTSGILPAGRLPVFTGDIVKPAGSSSINLAPIDITAGDYVKPTVDAKGRVTAGGVITEADLPNISWNKVSTGKPTTVEGYGITDALTTAGGTLSGFLTFNGSITGTMQAVTKQYVDVTLSSSTGIAIGDIIRKPYGTTPAGFLKCNGAEVDKTTYNALYATIGNRFNKNQNYTLGKPWQQQYNINEQQTNDLNSWVQSGTLTYANYAAIAFATKNRVYYGCGWTTAYINSFATAPINPDGSFGTWTAGPVFPISCGYGSAFVIKNRVYVAGCWSGSGSNGIFSAPINADGTIGDWVTWSIYPTNASFITPIITHNKIYIIGGHNGSNLVSTVYYATINSDGTFGTWSTGTNFPMAAAEYSVISTKNRVYILGILNGSGNATATVYTAPINTDGTLGTWVLAPYLPISIRDTQVFVTKNKAYILGGHNGSTSINTVLVAPINTDGTLGTWSFGTPLPNNLSHSQVVVTKNRINLLGGLVSSGTTAIISNSIAGGMNDYSAYYAADDTNYLMPGSGKPWEQQYQINNLQTTNITNWVVTTSLPAAIASSQAVVTKNRVYLLGGTNGTTAISTVYTAPINADGTLGTWTTGTSLPSILNLSQAIVTKNYVYLLGGHNGTAYVSTVYTAPINTDGTLGTWTTGTPLPGTLGHSQAIITKNRIYLLGGIDSSNGVNSIYTAPINADGTLGTWSSSGTIPQTKWAAKAFVTKNRVYLAGGWNGTELSTVHSASINSDGLIGTWKTETNLPVNLVNSSVIVFNKKVFILGSGTLTLGTSISSVYTANILSDGTLDSWTLSNSLPDNSFYMTPFIVKDRIYLCGRMNGVTTYPSVYMASILGGENDYSPYYDGTITPIIPVDQSTVFALPDLTQDEKFDTVSYIKY